MLPQIEKTLNTFEGTGKADELDGFLKTIESFRAVISCVSLMPYHIAITATPSDHIEDTPLLSSSWTFNGKRNGNLEYMKNIKGIHVIVLYTIREQYPFTEEEVFKPLSSKQG